MVMAKIQARRIDMYLPQRLAETSLSVIAEYFNVGYYSMVNQTIKRLAVVVAMLSQELTP